VDNNENECEDLIYLKEISITVKALIPAFQYKADAIFMKRTVWKKVPTFPEI
jgi:hypothetical protein